MPFGNVYATWVCILERASQVSYGGRFCEYCNDEFKTEVAFQLGYSKSDVEKIISAFDGKLINQNTIKNWERHQIDPTNKSRQLKYRDKSAQSNGNNSVSPLYNGVTVEERRGEEIRIDKKESKKEVAGAPPWPDDDKDNTDAYELAGNGYRLKSNWGLPDKWYEWTKAEFGWTEERIITEAKKFLDYWISPDAKKPIKKDWKMTWKNWCRTSSGGKVWQKR
jgi:hypothetical protein